MLCRSDFLLPVDKELMKSIFEIKSVYCPLQVVSESTQRQQDM